MQYLSGTGPFAPWVANKEVFQKQHVCDLSSQFRCSNLIENSQPDDPQLVWEQLKSSEGVADLARFAIMLLGLTVNQAPNERSFSDLKIKKTRLRNRLGTKKLEKMSKVSIVANFIQFTAHISTFFRSERISGAKILQLA